jgi:diguanylate cyclase (GGDEF)-like protein/PAS domain S-box-containing protein
VTRRLFVPTRIALTGTGCVAAVFGIVMATGWMVRATDVVQWRATDAPTQFNTAAGLIGCGLALVALGGRAARLSALIGWLIALLGILTLAQDVLNIHLGIDTALFDPYLTVQTSTPGRMGPNAALCLTMLGLALGCMPLRTPLAAGMRAIAALTSAAIALVAAIGYPLHVEMAYGWFALTQLDFPSAAVIALVSFTLVCYSSQDLAGYHFLARLRVPVLIFAAMSTVTCTIWLSLLNAEHRQLRVTANEDIQRLIARLQGSIDAELQSLKHLRQRWQIYSGMNRHHWRIDAGAITSDSAMLRAVAYVDAQRRVALVAPLPLESKLLGVDLGDALDGLAALESARANGKLTFTHVVPLPQGGEGMMAFLPLPEGGFIAGMFNISGAPEQAMTHAAPGRKYGLELYDGEQLIYRSGEQDAIKDTPEFVLERTFSLQNIALRLRLWPTDPLAEVNSSWIPAAVLYAGLCMSFLLASVSLLVQLSASRARRLQNEVAERQRAEGQNALLLAELEVVFANVVVGIALVKDGCTVRCNTRYGQLLGSPVEQILGQAVGPHHPCAQIMREHASAGPDYDVELELTRADGTVFWAACFGKALDPADTSRGTVWVIEEISARKRAEENLLFQAQHDALTGLANRTGFGKSLEQALARAAKDERQIGVCYIDLDKFKHVNDTYGHDAGDYLLMTVARRLTGSVRESDTVARLGGDEFALILSGNIDHDIITCVLNRILASLALPLEYAGHRFAVSGSIGMAIFPDHGADAPTLLKHADTAMYEAKQAGRNNWRLYEPEPANGGLLTGNVLA